MGLQSLVGGHGSFPPCWADALLACDFFETVTSGGARLFVLAVITHAGSGTVSASYLEVTPPDSATHLTTSFRQLVDGGGLDVTALARTVSFRI